MELELRHLPGLLGAYGFSDVHYVEGGNAALAAEVAYALFRGEEGEVGRVGDLDKLVQVGSV